MKALGKVKTIEEQKYKEKLDEIEEHYEEHLNEILTEYVHRGDIVSTNRLLGYADAMMATCATFLVLPLRNLSEKGSTESLASFIDKVRLEIVMFFLGFLVVLNIWEQTIIRSFFIKRLDDFLVLLVILSMLSTTILPFSLSLMGHFPEESVTAILTCVMLGISEIIDFIMVVYVAFTPRLLHIEIRSWSKKDIRRFCLVAVIKNGINLLLLTTAGLLYMLHYTASWVFIALLVLNPLIRKGIFFVRRRLAAPTNMEKCQFFWNFTKGNISKERVEVMSDAAMAIIACILILDITVEEFPKVADVHAHGLVSVLEHMTTEFVTFYAAFASVSALWYVNHTVLHLFHTMNVVTLYLQKFFLAFICFFPLASNMVNKYGRDSDENGKVSVLFGTMVMLFAGLCNLLILIYGLKTKEKYLHSWAVRACAKENVKQHMYIILKSVNVPFWNFVCALGTLGSPSAVKYVTYVCSVGLIASFFILKLIFMNNFGKEIYCTKGFVLENVAAKETLDHNEKDNDDVNLKKCEKGVEKIMENAMEDIANEIDNGENTVF